MTPRIDHVNVLRLNLRDGEPLPAALETPTAEFAWCDGWFGSLPDAIRADYRTSRLYGSGASLAAFLTEARRGQLAAHSVVEPAHAYAVVDVYQAVRQSPKWEESLLVVTWGDGKGDVGRPADLVDVTRPRQRLLQRDEVDRLVALVERDHALEDAPVRLAIEIAAVDDLCRQVERVVVDEDRAEHGSLGLEVVRERTLRSGNGGFGQKGRPSVAGKGSSLTRCLPRRSAGARTRAVRFCSAGR